MKPNIVFILLDNVGWGDIGCYGDAGSQRRHQRARIAEGSGHSPERLKPSEPLANLVPTGER